MLPTTGNTMHSYGGQGVDRDEASASYEKLVRPPPEVLAAAFGVIRERRTNAHPDSVTYVFGEPKRDLFGRTMCRAWRVIDHPPPTPPPATVSLQGGHAIAVFPDRPADLKPITEYTEARCDDARMEKYVPGSLTTPVPRHPDR